MTTLTLCTVLTASAVSEALTVCGTMESPCANATCFCCASQASLRSPDAFLAFVTAARHDQDVGLPGDHLGGPKQRDSTAKQHRSPSTTENGEEAPFLADRGTGPQQRYKVAYPDKDDTHLLLSDVKGWFSRQRRK